MELSKILAFQLAAVTGYDVNGLNSGFSEKGTANAYDALQKCLQRRK